MIANNRKLAADYRKHDLYVSNKLKYNQCLNTTLIAVQQLYTESRDRYAGSSNNQAGKQNHWENLSHIQKLKQAFT